MSEGDDESGKEHFREGKKHLEKGTQKVMEAGLKKGREQTKKWDYYRQNRSEEDTESSVEAEVSSDSDVGLN